MILFWLLVAALAVVAFVFSLALLMGTLAMMPAITMDEHTAREHEAMCYFVAMVACAFAAAGSIGQVL